MVESRPLSVEVHRPVMIRTTLFLRTGLAAAIATLALQGCGDDSLSIDNERPTAVATLAAGSVSPGDRVEVDASQSADDDGYIRRYTYDWGDGSADEISVEPLASHSYEDVGSYTISVSVIDDRGAKDSTTLTLNVLP